MDWKLFLQVAATIAAAFGGGWLGHRFSAHRDLLNERRKLRITYLLEAYRRLEKGSNRTSDTSDNLLEIESAIADIQLLGSPQQVSLAREFSHAMAEQQAASLDDLIYDLRRSLREELHLPEIEDSISYLRIERHNASSFHSTLIETRKNITDAKIEGAATAPPSTRIYLDNQENIAAGIFQIVAAWQQLEEIITDKLDNMRIKTTGLGPVILLQTALESGAITETQHRSLLGLNAMRNLAVHSPDQEIDNKKVEDFLVLSNAIKTVLEISGGHENFRRT